MADRQTPPSSHSGGSRQAPPRRNDVIRCENCGEDYSITYKRCPFCDERPGRGGYTSGGRRVANTRGGGYGKPINPIQVVGLVISLILIIAALVIVFKFVGGPLLDKGGESTSQSQSGVTPNPGSSSSGQSTDPSAVQSITLNESAISLAYEEFFQMTAVLSPENAEGTVTWTSSDPSTAKIDEFGIITNVNKGSSEVSVTITATCGDASAQCTVLCAPQNPGTSDPGSNPSTPAGPVAPNTPATIVNAENGLNIRSGPGPDYDVVASAQNGAKITILGEENGWYKIHYIGTNAGYISKDYVSIDK